MWKWGLKLCHQWIPVPVKFSWVADTTSPQDQCSTCVLREIYAPGRRPCHQDTSPWALRGMLCSKGARWCRVVSVLSGGLGSVTGIKAGAGSPARVELWAKASQGFSIMMLRGSHQQLGNSPFCALLHLMSSPLPTTASVRLCGSVGVHSCISCTLQLSLQVDWLESQPTSLLSACPLRTWSDTAHSAALLRACKGIAQQAGWAEQFRFPHALSYSPDYWKITWKGCWRTCLLR